MIKIIFPNFIHGKVNINYLDPTNEIAEASNHPVHLVNTEGKPMPSALIPFCSFGDNVGETMREDFTLPVCTMFQPTILDGQKCYQPKDDLYTGQGMHQGLAFMIDICLLYTSPSPRDS